MALMLWTCRGNLCAQRRMLYDTPRPHRPLPGQFV